MILGVVLLAIILTAPRGLVGIWRDLTGRRKPAKSPETEDPREREAAP
jgi:hypothetical protein